MSDYIQFPRLVFHATLLKYLDSIKDRILIHREDALINLDFGKGFYTTTSYQQAAERAKLLQERERSPKNGALRREDRGIIISFELDSQLLYTVPKEQRKVFHQLDSEWANYIVFNRMYRTLDTPHDFKWTYGSLADGRAIGYLCKQYVSGEISVEQLIHGYTQDGYDYKGIAPYSERYNQLSFHEDEELVNLSLKFNKFDIIDQYNRTKQVRW
ncbi:DUF3990 domain-containing protein [Paenibacillus sp. FSL R5-0527]|uniref:DUF3990 domain-containing protein n=1 Tax=Paenibacillus TaxID=44249 RepID=UPI00097B33A8|nr:DUF3990 domain-containing protein [Paenibacillus macerans]OMG47388.1 hypothetical protein BK140_22225 [Paenibacillus macerans]